MAINGWGAEKRGSQNRHLLSITLPTIELDDIDIEREAKEAAERIATRKIIRQGRDALGT